MVVNRGGRQIEILGEIPVADGTVAPPLDPLLDEIQYSVSGLGAAVGVRAVVSSGAGVFSHCVLTDR